MIGVKSRGCWQRPLGSKTIESWRIEETTKFFQHTLPHYTNFTPPAAKPYSFETDPSILLAVHTFAPSKAIPTGAAPTGKVPSTSPSQSRSLVMLLLPRFVTHRFVPSNAMNCGLDPTANVPVIFPSLGRSRDTVLLLELATQTDVPSKATPTGFSPTANVPSSAPSLARSFVTVFALPWFATQMF